MLKKIVLILLFVLFLSACSPEAESPVRILIIGDSYVENHGGMDTHIVGLANANQPSQPVEGKSIAEGAMPLSGHWQLAPARDAIQEQDWTVVVLQGDVALEGRDSNGEYNKERFFEHVRLFHEAIQDSGAETILLMHWENHTMTTEEIAAAHYEIASELGVKVAPVGLAWEKSLEQRPDLDLYAPDQSHANMDGEYLAVAVLYATIFEESPEGLAYFPEDQYRGGRISQENAEFLQKIAWETVTENQ